jgi:hypothetical protein
VEPRARLPAEEGSRSTSAASTSTAEHRRDRIWAANASIPSTTLAKRSDSNRSKVYWPPGSSAYTTGFDEVERRVWTKARASLASTIVSRSPCAMKNGGASARTYEAGDDIEEPL